jgi:hypothetical protein
VDKHADLLKAAMSRTPLSAGRQEARDWLKKVRPTHTDWSIGELAEAAIRYADLDIDDVVAEFSNFEDACNGTFAEQRIAFGIFSELMGAQEAAHEIDNFRKDANEVYIHALWVDLVLNTVGETDAITREADDMKHKIGVTIGRFVQAARGEVRVNYIIPALMQKYRMSRAEAEEALTVYLEKKEPKPVEQAA